MSTIMALSSAPTAALKQSNCKIHKNNTSTAVTPKTMGTNSIIASYGGNQNLKAVGISSVAEKELSMRSSVAGNFNREVNAPKGQHRQYA